MIRINLLPVRAFKRRENIRLQVSIFLLSVVALVLILGGVYMNKNRKVDDLLIQKEKLKRQWEAQQKVLTKLALQEQTAVILEERVSLITDLIKERSGPVQLLDQIVDLTPEGQVWLTAMIQQVEAVQELVLAEPAAAAAKAAPAKAADDGNRKALIEEQITPSMVTRKETVKLEPKIEVVKKNRLTLDGVAKDNLAIAQYIEALEGSPLLKDAALTISQEKIIDGFRLKRFTIKATIDYSDLSPKPEKEEAVTQKQGGGE